MQNSQYWIDRAELKMDAMMKLAARQERTMAVIYKDLYKEIAKEMSYFYTKYGDSKGVLTLAEAQKYNRLKNLYKTLQGHLDASFRYQQQDVAKFLKGALEESYYVSIFNIQQGVGVGTSFNLLPDKTIQNVLQFPWSGQNFSSNLWDSKKQLLGNMQNTIQQGLIRGEGYREMAKNLQTRVNTSYSNARRIIQTETSYVVNQSDKIAYEELGVDDYKYIATLDSRTSDICSTLDGEVFKVSDATPGVNYPPMHPNCRSTTRAWFGRNNVGTRAARLPDNKRYLVPADMTYNEWKEQTLGNASKTKSAKI